MKILYKINFLHFIFFPQFVFATSKAILPDGIARAIVKNNLPCVYLSNGKKVSRITFTGAQVGYIDKRSIDKYGNSQESCIFYNKSINELKYNQPYYIFVNNEDTDGNLYKAHFVQFCIEQNENRIKLVNVNTDENGGNCSNQDWKPQKYYGGLFGWLEKLKDSIFNKDIVEYK